MTDTMEDAEREAFYDRITEEILRDHRDQIVAEFVEDRLASYFEERPELWRPAQRALVEARTLESTSAAAALVFAMSSVEISIRDVLLKPVVAGLVHNPDLSEIVADIVDIRSKKILTLLSFVMTEIGLPALPDQLLPSGRPVWVEKSELQKLRNSVVHRGDTVTSEQAQRAMELAEYFVEQLYPQIRDHLTHRSTGWV